MMEVLGHAAVALLVLVLSGEASAQESLVEVIERGDTRTVRQLLDAGANPDVRNGEGVPALMLASLFADAECVGLLLEHGADPNLTDASGATALMWAIPNIEKVRLLLDHGAQVNAQSGSLGRTPLLIAAAYPGTDGLLELLVENGADITVSDSSGAIPLELAMRSADVSVLRYLIENGVGSIDQVPIGALRPTYSRERPATIEYLSTRGIPIVENILAVAANWQEPELIERWIDQGANVNAPGGPYGRTPLITAASSELAGADTLRVLLDRGADPNVATSEGERPLDWAIYRNDPEKIAVLEAYGAMRGDGPRRVPVPPPAPGRPLDPEVSVRESVSLLLNAAPPMFELRGCVTCHHNALPGVAAATARRKGIPIDEELAAQNLGDIRSAFQRAADSTIQGNPAFAGGNSATLGYSMMALAAEDYPLDTLTATMTHWTLASQMPDGRWLGNGINRPPIEYSTVSHTALAVQALIAYPIPGRQSEVRSALAKAQGWLRSAETASAEERAMRLLGLAGTGLSVSDLEDAIGEIVSQQRATGGWSQLATLDPDAYATGLSLFALRAAGMPVDDPVYQAGVDFLLSTQYPDGSWFVRSRALPVQPYFESGFPFGRHQWISAAGTGWAALAIASTLPDIETGN